MERASTWGEVLCRNRRIEHGLNQLAPPWTVVRLRRKDIDLSGEQTVERVRALLG
jgi:hypothetical protein